MKTIERELMKVAKDGLPRKKLAKEVLEEFMFLMAGMAARYQPYAPDVAPNRHEDPEKFWKCVEATCTFAAALAKFQSPTFRAVVIAPPPPEQNDEKVFTLTIFDHGGRKLIEHQLKPDDDATRR